ncbi:ecotropic viral integration site 5 protein, partial [Tremellales sp. Uapishka_1]
MTEPSSPDIKAAQELELDDALSDDEVLQDVSPSSPDPAKLSPSPTKTDPPKSPSRVKAAAALWETASTSAPNLSPSSSSFRSVPVSSKDSSPKKADSPGKRIIPDRLVLPSSPDVDPAPATGDALSDVSLSNPSPVLPTREFSRPLSIRNFSYSTPPKPVDLSEMLPEPVITPPEKEVQAKGGFFSATLGFGYPSGNTAVTAASAHAPPPISRTPSASSQGQGAGGWRSTVTNLLGSRAVTPSASTSPRPQPPSPSAFSTISLSSPHPASGPSNSTSFLMQRVESSQADRRHSREVGGGAALREGFNRVRGEMEGVAREMRREREGRAVGLDEESAEAERSSEGGVDWVFWGAVVQDYEDVARTRPKELSKAIQRGIPAVIRGAIWQLMSSSKSAPLEETYKTLLKLNSPHEKAIAKDLSRTFPNHKFFQEGGGVGQESLFMVVKAYSLYDEEVGYTQGLAFIVAALLLNMPDEEAFCVLVRLMESYNLRSHFLADMPGLQLRLFQFDRLVEEILPLLHTHLVRQGVKSSMFASQWFMTMFSYRFPLSLVYRVLDIVFAEGIEAIFRFSVALLKRSEDKLSELEFEQILNYLQTDLFEMYRVTEEEMSAEDREEDHLGEEEWKANDFVRDAYEVRITPFMLDSYQSEWDELCRSQNKHALEVDQLRNANRNLSFQVKNLEASFATMNQEHVELVRQLVMSKIEKEETENELVRYKMLYAELAHAQQDAMSTHSRLSASSVNTQRHPSLP